MNRTTDASDAITRAKAPLQRNFLSWNIVHSSVDQWWAFRDPNRQRKDTAPAKVAALDADTSEGLYKLFAAVES
ncbi:hypothetical protein [Actinomadura bangladeshensis]|uniref:Uncharacterized protein n=1 Tax=Actinomadura bangladeshensis TaxID=453573 RepID=A0A6L9QRA4_9ACTN|nr:hypothetical protein [Actinomadura bangladeshensis]NEA27628.1 hypothetical protein [Actinomadura bangladeshensis]